MMKQMVRGSVIEIWQKDYINKESWMAIDPKDEDAKIIQIEYAYEDWFMVEVVRKPVDDIKNENNKRVLVEEDLEQ